MKIREFSTNKDTEIWAEIKTSKETKHFGTSRGFENYGVKTVTHKLSGKIVGQFITKKDAHKFMWWCEENIGSRTAEQLENDGLGKVILTQLHTYPSRVY